eukprot:CAMPEP_0205925214 /NCGR_PEP_ID=MMETSP1325-20131115/17741_1 /ASSEMBLY_ACC=CAM_ASM_000708 /TAXON_ID=236786 /ORGANISM="Florenciella sp., Strain RCC1007" /LENGTH=205 /DNA_ID=CAMNT_0053293713 /DNA_START=96 /DNA_END=713 /DNA_ORIENTATION=-
MAADTTTADAFIGEQTKGAVAKFTMSYHGGYFEDKYTVKFPYGIKEGAKITFQGSMQGDTGSSVMHVAPRDQVQGHGTVRSVGSDHFEIIMNGAKLHVEFRQCTFTPRHVTHVLLGTKPQPEAPEEIELRELKKMAVEEGMLLAEVRGMSAAALRLEISKRRREGVTTWDSTPGSLGISTITHDEGAAEAETTVTASRIAGEGVP